MADDAQWNEAWPVDHHQDATRLDAVIEVRMCAHNLFPLKAVQVKSNVHEKKICDIIYGIEIETIEETYNTDLKD